MGHAWLPVRCSVRADRTKKSCFTLPPSLCSLIRLSLLVLPGPPLALGFQLYPSPLVAEHMSMVVDGSRTYFNIERAKAPRSLFS